MSSVKSGINRFVLCTIIALTFSLAVSACGGGADSSEPPANTDNTDNPVITDTPATPGISVGAKSGDTAEATGTATFTVVLDSEPTDNVTIAVSSSDATEGAVDLSSLIFTSADWSTAQTVTVTGVNDDIDDGDIAYTITLATSVSTDTDYSAIDPPDISLINTDDDTSGISVGAKSGDTTEATGTATFTVVLDSEPTDNVTIAVSSSDATEGAVDLSSLIFTSADWSTAQTVTATGVNDDIDDGDIAYTITLATSVSTDTDYSAIDPPDISLINTDDDTSGVTVGTVSGDTTEASGTATFTVVLDSEPTADVTIGISSSNTNEGTVDSSSLLFTSDDWSTPQTVTVTGINDTVIDSDTLYTVAVSMDSTTDSIYNLINPTDVDITNFNDDGWAQEAYVKPPNTQAYDYFGSSVSIDVDTLAVGATDEDNSQTTITNGTTVSEGGTASNSGAVYVYKRNPADSTWAQEAYVKAPNAYAGRYFGGSVSINADTVAVGSSGDSTNQTTITNGTTATLDHSASGSGAVHLFKRNPADSTWAQEAYVKASNSWSYIWFGGSVSINADTVAVGAVGEGSNQTTITNGTTASADLTASNSGAVYVYKRNPADSTWAQEAYVKASNAEVSDKFGYSLSINGDTLAVGTTQEDSNQTTITNGTTASADNSAQQSGAVYVYKRTGTNWAQEAYVKAPNAESNDNFGWSVSLNADTLAVGAYHESSNQTTITNGTTASANNAAYQSGAVYVYKRTGTNWAQEAYVKASNAESYDSFGSSVSINGDTLVVGAKLEDSNQTTITNGITASASNSTQQSGAVYVYKRNPANSTWAQEAYVKAPNAGSDDNFGYSVSINADTLAVGAIFEDSNQTTITNGITATLDNSAADSGAVYVFNRTIN